MYRSMFRSTIHRATVTGAELLEAADILPNQQVEICSVTNGERFRTYALRGQPGSGVICINGAAAHKDSPGDLAIIATFSWMADEQARDWQSAVVFVDARKRIAQLRSEQAGQTELGKLVWQ